MNLTTEGLLLAAFLLLPGFVYYFVSRNTKTTYREPPSDARIALDSFAVTLVLVGAEIALLAVLTLIVGGVRSDVKAILKDGVGSYIDDKPLTFFYIVVVVGFANVIVMGVSGGFDWIESAIVWILRRQKQAPWNVWYHVIREGPEPDRKRSGPLKVRVRLKDGGLYVGTLAAYPLSPAESRDLALWEISFSESGNPRKLQPVSRRNRTAVILPVDQAKGIEFIYPPS